MVRFKAHGDPTTVSPKYHGNIFKTIQSTFRSLEIHFKSDSKRRYKNLCLFGNPMGNSITVLNPKILGFLFFNEK